MFDLGKTIREMFPEQTKSLLSTVIWTLLLLVDIALVFWVAWALGFDIFSGGGRKNVYLYILIAAALWYGECVIYDKIRGAA